MSTLPGSDSGALPGAGSRTAVVVAVVVTAAPSSGRSIVQLVGARKPSGWGSELSVLSLAGRMIAPDEPSSHCTVSDAGAERPVVSPSKRSVTCSFVAGTNWNVATHLASGA